MPYYNNMPYYSYSMPRKQTYNYQNNQNSDRFFGFGLLPFGLGLAGGALLARPRFYPYAPYPYYPYPYYY